MPAFTTGQPVKLNWEALALWFGRLLFLVALYYGKSLLAEVENLRVAQEAQVQSVRETQATVANLARVMQLRTEKTWTQIDQRLWAGLLAQYNTKLVVPEPIHQELPGETVR